MTGYDKPTLLKAKRLRRDLTDAERKLWSILRSTQAGAKFRRQQPIGPFIADFVCQTCKLIIEVDGGQHADSNSDASRTAFLNRAGYRVIRFWNNEIHENLDAVAQAITAALATPHPAQPRIETGSESPSPSRGEGIGAPHG